MKKIIPIIFAILLLSAVVLCGCSSQKSSYDYSGNAGSPAYEAPYPGEAAFDNTDSGITMPSPSDGESGTAVLVNRKIIRNAELSVEALDFEGFIAKVNEKVRSYGGYVQSNYVDSSDYSSGRLRTAETVMRIPSDKLDAFLSDVNGLGNVIRQNENLSDVTDRYVDTEARLSSLRTEYSTLLGLLEKALNLDEIIQLQDRLTDVRYRIESYEAQLRSYDNQIDYSTITLHVREVKQETVVSEESFGQETSRRFGESLASIGDGFVSFAKWFIGNLPYIILVLLVPAVIIIIAVSRSKAAKKRRQTAPAAADNAGKDFENKA